MPQYNGTIYNGNFPMKILKPSLPALILRYASRLRFPKLALLTAGLFGLDVLVPDLIPFVDEILFGLAALLFASWKRQKPQDPIIDIQTEEVGQKSQDPVIDIQTEEVGQESTDTGSDK